MPFVVGSIKQAKIGETMLALGVLCITCSGCKKESLQQLLQVDPSKYHVPEPQHGILPQAQVKRVSGQNDDPLQQELLVVPSTHIVPSPQHGICPQAQVKQ